MRLLITGAWSEAEKYIDEIKQRGHAVVFMQWEKDELPVEPDWVEGVIGNGLFLYHPLSLFSNLRYIQLTSAGFDRVDMAEVEKRNIEIHNAKGVYSVPMAEFAVCGVLQIYKQSRYFFSNQKEHKWQKHRGLRELTGKTVCVVGCGSVGRECAKRFSAFGCKLTGVDLFPCTDEIFSQVFLPDQFNQAIAEADVVIFTLPLTQQTQHLIDETRFRSFKKDAILVNLSRGGLIASEVLEKNIDKIGGAVLDVFEDEPLNENSLLWDHDHVIVTPHNSFIGEGNGERLKQVILSRL